MNWAAISLILLVAGIVLVAIYMLSFLHYIGKHGGLHEAVKHIKRQLKG